MSETTSRNMRKPDLKVVMLGDANIGKTCLVLRYIDRRFQNTVNTIGASFILKHWGHYNIAIWDTAGEEKYSGLSNFYCRSAAAAVLTFDLTSRTTFETLRKRYIPLLNSVNSAKLKVIVGTKKDLIQKYPRQVTAEEGMELARALNPHVDSESPVPYFETSSKTGVNVDEAFEYAFQYFFPNGGSEPRPLVVEDHVVSLMNGNNNRTNNNKGITQKKKTSVSCCN